VGVLIPSLLIDGADFMPDGEKTLLFHHIKLLQNIASDNDPPA